MDRLRRGAISAAEVLAAVSGAAAAPNFTMSIVISDGAFVQDLGVVGAQYAPNGFTDLAIRNDGSWFMQVRSAGTNNPQGLLQSPLVTPTYPYLVQGIGVDDLLPGSQTGYLTDPSTDYVPTGFSRTEVSNDGRAVFEMPIGPAEFASVNPSSGVYLSRDQLVIQEGDAVTAPGLAPGTTWNAFGASSQAKINDVGQILLISSISESGVDKTAVIVVNIDGTGNIVSESLVAKEGGPVGAGPDTWLAIATGTHASAINNSGDVLFSGQASGGTTGLFLNGSFVATDGGATPVAGLTWRNLFGCPVDLNNNGDFVMRALTSNPDPVWNEVGDAGENPNIRLEHNITQGDGPLDRIVGTLSDDQDVDIYSIYVDDPANFSATTVPASGFTGANFDTVLTLFAAGGTTPAGITRNDDAAPGVIQSTITGTNLNTTPHEYALAISTRKSRAIANEFSVLAFNGVPNDTVSGEMWASDPGAVAYNNGAVYYVDHDAGVIHSSDLTGAPFGPDIVTGSAIGSSVAIYDGPGTADKIYWIDRGNSKIVRSDLDGSNVEDVFTVVSYPSGPSSGQVWSLAVDSVNQKLYWTRGAHGEIDRSDLDGFNPELVVQSIGAPTAEQQSGIFRIAVDPTGGKVYWTVPRDGRIGRCNLDGTGIENFVTGVDPYDIAVDSAAGKVYWTDPSANAVRRLDVGGGSIETVLATDGPLGLSLDTAGGEMFWTNGGDRVVRRSSIVSPAAQDVVSLGPDTAERAPDGLFADATLAQWDRSGSPSGASLGYQIKLTGATFAADASMIAKNNAQKVAASGDVLADLSPARLFQTGTDSGPVYVTDHGNVVWWGQWDEATVSNGTFSGLFQDQNLLLRNVDTFQDPEPVPPSPFPGNVIYFGSGQNGFDVSSSGEYMLARVNHFTSYPLTPFGQADSVVLFQFEQPTCPCELDGDTAQVNVFDLLAYLSLWFPQNGMSGAGLSADFNDSGNVDVFDLLDFLSCWFPASAGNPCP